MFVAIFNCKLESERFEVTRTFESRGDFLRYYYTNNDSTIKSILQINIFEEMAKDYRRRHPEDVDMTSSENVEFILEEEDLII